MQMALNGHRLQRGLYPLNVIEPDDYIRGYTLFVFNMQEDISDRVVVRRQGNLRLDFKFAHPLVNPITVITYAVYKSEVEIDCQKDVTMDYTA